MPVSYGFLSTYPPTECGLATFTAALARRAPHRAIAPAASASSGSSTGSRAHHATRGRPPPRHRLPRRRSRGGRHPQRLRRRHRPARVRHLRRARRRPGPRRPRAAHRPGHRRPPHRARRPDAPPAGSAGAGGGRRRRGGHHDPHRPAPAPRTGTRSTRPGSALIPHGAADNRVRPTGHGSSPAARPTILTWGLLGPGKGIEWVVDALAELRDLEPEPRYLVVGRDPPQGGGAGRRGLPPRAHGPGRAPGRRPPGRVRRPVPVDLAALGRVVAGADVVHPALRLPGAGHLRCAGRGAGGRQAGDRHRVPARRRAARRGAGLIVPHGDSAGHGGRRCAGC